MDRQEFKPALDSERLLPKKERFPSPKNNNKQTIKIKTKNFKQQKTNKLLKYNPKLANAFENQTFATHPSKDRVNSLKNVFDQNIID